VKKIKNNFLIFGIFVIGLLAGYVFYLSENFHSRTFSIEYDRARTPYVKTIIDDIEGYFLIDLGAAIHCSIQKNYASNLHNASFLGEKKFVNFTNTVYEVNEYVLKEVDFLDLNIEDLVITLQSENTDLFEFNSPSFTHSFTPSKFVNESDIIGSIGNKLLKNMNFLIDFKKSSLTLYPSSYIPLFRFPYKNVIPSENVLFEHDQNIGFICRIKINGYSKRFLIDTGSSYSLIKQSSAKNICVTDQEIITVDLELGQSHFSNQILHLSENFQLKDLDGILGMDFFKNKVLFFNTEKKIISLSYND
jgi:hypothetical protein